METVLYYDVESRQVVRMPASELRPGCIQARVEGIDEIVWVLPQQLKEGPVRHPPFDEQVRGYIREIQDAFAEHYPLSFDEWEEGFRRDAHPEREIAIWSHAADVYRQFANTPAVSADQRKEIFQIVAACMTASPESVWNVIELSALTRAEAEQIVGRYYEAST